MTKKSKARRDCWIQLNKCWGNFDEDGVEIRYLWTADGGYLADAYAVFSVSTENGLWLVSRWGRTDECDAPINYCVYDVDSVDPDLRSEAPSSSYCTCEGFRFRPHCNCRHLDMVELAKASGEFYMA